MQDSPKSRCHRALCVNNSMDKIVDILRNGGVSALPTDNLFCLAADASNETAVNKIFEIKGRSDSSAIPILIADFSDVEKYTINQPEALELIAEKYWPGSLTIVLTKTKTLAPNISPGMDTIGIRIPNHQFPCKIVEILNRPLITTSVNIHSTPPLLNVKDIKKYFSKINIFEDVNMPNKSSGSTIIDLTKYPNQILRQGDGAYTL